MNIHSVKYFLFIHRLTFLTANGPLWDLYRTLLFEFPVTRLGHVGQIERKNHVRLQSAGNIKGACPNLRPHSNKRGNRARERRTKPDLCLHTCDQPGYNPRLNRYKFLTTFFQKIKALGSIQRFLSLKLLSGAMGTRQNDYVIAAL